MQPDDDIIIPQDDLYVITWQTNLKEFPNSTEEITIPTRLDTADASDDIVDDASPPDEIFTDVDLRSTGPHENGNSESFPKTFPDGSNDWRDDQ